METQFRLKKEARQFFDKYKSDIHSLDFWTINNIHENLLEEVELCHIFYGHRKKINNDISSADLCSWDGNKKEGEFRFSLVVPNVDHKKFDSINVSELMDEMQKVCNRHFKNNE